MSTILVNAFIQSMRETTWFQCANTKQRKNFYNALVSHFGAYERVSEEAALTAVCGAIRYNQPAGEISPVSTLDSARLTMNEALGALRHS